MTDDLIVYKRTDVVGQIYGVPDGDLTQADLDRIPTLLRDVKASDLWEAADLTPAQKAAITRAQNARAEELAAIEQERFEAAQKAAEEEEARQLAALQAAEDAVTEEAE